MTGATARGREPIMNRAQALPSAVFPHPPDHGPSRTPRGDASPADVGTFELDVVDFDVRETVEDVCELLAPGARDKGVDLAAFVALGVPQVARGDAARLRRTLSSFVEDAVKLTDSGEIVVSVERVGAEAHEVVLRFELVDSGSRDPACWFTARLQRSDAMPRQTAAHHGLAGARVLVVGDDLTNRHLIYHQLRSWNMEVETVADSVSALDRMRDGARHGHPYELALLSYDLPDLNGLGLARVIKAEPELVAIHLIVLTSGPEQDHLVSEAGIASTLAKPVRQSRLQACIVSALTEPLRF